MKPSQAHQDAEALLRSHGLFAAAVNVEALVTSLGIDLRREAMEDEVSGLLVIKSGRSMILVNADHPPNRQRFTVAHEIGHFVLHAQRSVDSLYVDRRFATFQPGQQPVYTRATNSGDPKQEREANKFAADLLMPKELILESIRRNALDPSDEQDVGRLAGTFLVSEQAMLYRLQNLSLLSSADR